MSKTALVITNSRECEECHRPILDAEEVVVSIRTKAFFPMDSEIEEYDIDNPRTSLFVDDDYTHVKVRCSDCGRSLM